MTPTLTHGSPSDIDERFLAIVDELTRRGFLTGTLGGAALLGLAACGSGSDAAGDGSSPSASARASSTRTISSAYGDIEVPAEPRRVIALGKAALSSLLDVGVTPIATDDDEADVALSQYVHTVSGLPTVGSYGKLSVEKIAALQPDLLVTFDTYVDKALFSTISAVTPVVALKTDSGVIPWQTAATRYAEAVGRGAQVAALATRLQTRITAVKAAHGDLLRATRWEVVQDAGDGTFYRYLPASDPSTILTQLGATLGNAGATGADVWGKQHSDETIADQLGEADVVLCVKVGSKELVAQPLWKALPATEAGDVYLTDVLFPASYSGALALVDLIETICTRLKAKN